MNSQSQITKYTNKQGTMHDNRIRPTLTSGTEMIRYRIKIGLMCLKKYKDLKI